VKACYVIYGRKDLLKRYVLTVSLDWKRLEAMEVESSDDGSGGLR